MTTIQPSFEAAALPAAADLRALLERSDRKGLGRLAVHVGLIGATATAIYLSQGSLLLVPALVAHGILIAYLFAPFHEGVHYTPFKTRRLNDIVSWLCGVAIVWNATYYRYSHLAHHRFIQDPARDPELRLRKPVNVAEYLQRMSGYPYLRGNFRTLLRVAAGRFDNMPFIPEASRPRVRRSAIAHLMVYAGVAAFAVVYPRPILMYWLIPMLLGWPFLLFVLFAEHTGCADSGDNHQNTRTTYTWWPLRLIFWNMTFHAEHHINPAIPFHALPAAHALMKPRIAHISSGYLSWTASHLKKLWTASAALAIAVLGLVAAGPAAAQTHVRYDNGWLFDGGHAYGALAQDRGCFAREKLDVTMDRGFGSSDTLGKLAAGAYDVGEADFNTAAQFAATHPESRVIAIFIISDGSPASVMALKGHGIEKPQDLAGKSIADPVGEAARVLFPAFAAANGFDPKAVNWISIAPNLREQLLAQSRTDAIAGHVFVMRTGLSRLGIKPEDTVALRYADWGVNIFGPSLVTTTTWAEAHPEAATSFVRCIAEALKLEIADPQAAVAAVKARNSMLEDQLEIVAQKFSDTLVLTDNVRKNGLSQVTRDRLESALKQISAALGIPTPAADRVWTDKYLPPAAELKVD